VSLAQRITEATPPIAVPSEITLVLQDVNQGRSVCAEWYGNLTVTRPELGHGRLAELNGTHRHFIDVLKQIQDLLKATGSRISEKQAKKQRKVVKDAQTDNLFAILDLEEPSDAPWGNESTASIPRSEWKAAKKTEQVADTSAEDTALAIWCLFQDFRNIRVFVKDLWKSCHNGDVSFATASKITDTAIALIRDLEDAFVDAYPKLSPFVAIVDCLDIQLMTSGSELLAFSRSADTANNGSGKDKDGPQAAELFCMPAWCILSDFRTLCLKAESMTLSNLQSLYYGHPFASVLYAAFQDVKDLSSQAIAANDFHNVNGLETDEFTRALMCVAGLGSLQTWFLPACQIYMDLYDALGNEPKRGIGMCLQTVEWFQKSIDGYVNYVQAQSHHQGLWVTRLGEVSTKINSSLALGRTLGSVLKGLSGQHHILSILPVLAGKQLFNHVLIARHLWGTKAANDKFAVLGIAYLYKAASSIGACEDNWVDMECVIEQQSGKGQFLRDSKDGVERLACHFDLALGVEATVFASHGARRPELPQGRRLGERVKKVIPTSPYVVASLDCLRIQKRTGMDAKSKFYSILYQVARDSNDKSAGATGNALIPAQLLLALKNSLVGTEPELNFDYLTFYTRCQTLLDAILIDFHEELFALTGDKQEIASHEVVNEIL